MKEKSITTSRGTVFYWLSEDWDKSAPALVFLHGLTGDHTMFEKQLEYFSGRYNLLAWDAPAHGKSRPYTEFSYPDAAEVLRRILLENGIERAFLTGQSMGGFIAQSFLKRWPEMVRGFVGIDTTPFGESYYSKFDRWILGRIEWMARLYPLGLMKNAMAKQVAVTEYGRRNMAAMLEPYGKRELCHLMGIAYAGFLEDNCDLEINCPVLLLLGDRDRTGKVIQYNRAWAKNTGFPLKIIENAAHNSNVDRPEAVNSEIENFIHTAEQSV